MSVVIAVLLFFVWLDVADISRTLDRIAPKPEPEPKPQLLPSLRFSWAAYFAALLLALIGIAYVFSPY